MMEYKTIGLAVMLVARTVRFRVPTLETSRLCRRLEISYYSLKKTVSKTTTLRRNIQRQSTETVFSAEMEVHVKDLVKQIHSTSTKAVLYATGGAVSTISWLLAVPGASRTVIEAVVPYAQKSTQQILKGQTINAYSGKEHSVNLARAAYQRAAVLTDLGEWDFIGAAASCALATDRAKQGEHKCSIAIHGNIASKAYTLVLDKDSRTRLEEEIIASRLFLAVLAEAVGIFDQNAVLHSINSLLSNAEKNKMEIETDTLDHPLNQLLNGSVRCVEYNGKNFVLDAPRNDILILPGSFNPLHDGHKTLLKAAEKATGKRGIFELTVCNPDKGTIGKKTLEDRLQPFTKAGIPIMLTRAALFVEKADLFPDCIFVVGHDTAVRIIDPKYYNDSETRMTLILGRMRDRGCHFLVAGRAVDQDGEKRFLTLKDIEVGDDFVDLFHEIPDFRLDISSTEIRAQMTKNVESQ